MTTRLEKVIENAYKVFESYKVAIPLDVCTVCCMTKSEEGSLVSLGVRSIPFELLYKYNTAAKTEKPNIDEFKHFLPRFLELTSELKFLSHDAELVFGRFDYYDKKDWTLAEQDVLNEFAIEFFEYSLTVYPLPELERIDGIIIMLSKSYIDTEKILDVWTKVETKESVLHLNDLINKGFKDHNPNKLNSPFDKNNLGVKITNWLNTTTFSKKFLNIIEAIIMEPQDIEDYTLRELSWTYDTITMKTL